MDSYPAQECELSKCPFFKAVHIHVEVFSDEKWEFFSSNLELLEFSFRIFTAVPFYLNWNWMANSWIIVDDKGPILCWD